MTKQERLDLKGVIATQASTSNNLKQVTKALDSMASVLHEQSVNQAVTANNVTHIKEVIDGIPSVVEIKKDVEMLKAFRLNIIKVFLGLGTTSIIGFVAYIFNEVTKG